MKVPDQVSSVRVIEDVEEAAIQDSVVPCSSRFHLQRVGHKESGGKVSLVGLQLSKPDGPRRQVEPRRLETEFSGEQGVFARSTPNVKGSPGHGTRTRQFGECRLRMPDIPGG